MSDKIGKYLREFPEYFSRGVGFWFRGDGGTGKTAAAVVLGKEALLWGCSTYYTTFSRLQAAVKHKEIFEDNVTIESRVHSVDFLILDDFPAYEESKDWGFNTKQVFNLLKHRNENLKASVVVVVDAGLVSSVGALSNERSALNNLSTLYFSGKDRRVTAAPELVIE